MFICLFVYLFISSVRAIRLTSCFVCVQIPMQIVARRPGDAAEVYAKTDRAKEVLGWEAKFSIETCCVDQWKWASENPMGYGA